MKRTNILLSLFTLFVLLSSCKNDRNPNNNEVDYTQYENLDRKEILIPSQPEKPEENLSGELIVLTEEEFITMISDIDNPKGFQYKGETPCIVDFYADWCAPCTRLNPILMELAQEYKGEVIFYKLNTDKAINTSSAFKINSIPTLLLFKPHAIVTVIEGALPKDELKNAIETVLLSEN